MLATGTALSVAAVLASDAQSATVPLGRAGSNAVLGGSTVTNTGPSVISGDVGLSPGTAVTGFPPGMLTAGTIHAADSVASQAKSDLAIAYVDAAGRSSTASISADLAGRRLTPGVYTSSSSLGLTGDLTLDAQGDPDAVFIFQAGSQLTVASASRVLLVGSAQECNVFWLVGSSATIGTSSAFAGNILALTSISLTTGATLRGRALARNGAVTLDTNTISPATCAPTSSTPPTSPPTSSGTTTATAGQPASASSSTGAIGAAGTTGTPADAAATTTGTTGSAIPTSPAGGAASTTSTAAGATATTAATQATTAATTASHGTTAATPAATGGKSTASATLPFTGLNVIWLLLGGATLLAAGTTLRRIGARGR
jgi:hypothetical protein